MRGSKPCRADPASPSPARHETNEETTAVTETRAPLWTTKILVTLGPASSAPGRIEGMARAGASAFRLNFSHGSHDEHRARINAIREAEKAVGRPLAILADLQGPKLRVGRLPEEGLKLGFGETYEAVKAEEAPDGRIPINHPELFEALKAGDTVSMNDGALRFVVEEVAANRMRLKCEVPGTLTSNKGINVPGRKLPLDALTEKDREDLEMALDEDVDFVALSFVQSADDLRIARKALRGTDTALIAKIEKPGAIDDLEAITREANGLMVARGDLGVELPLEQVPLAQRRIIRAARAAGKPVIVATQMLESMIENPLPTRAEASDTAAAAYLGADAVMLSAETAVGRHPETAVAIMGRIVRAVNDDDGARNEIFAAADPAPRGIAETIAAAAARAADAADASAIVAATISGGTAVATAKCRPVVPVLALATRERTARRLALYWGVSPVLVKEAEDFEALCSLAAKEAGKRMGLEPGNRIVLVAGIPGGRMGGTNTMKIITIGDRK
jgi:pyruvate kinase